MHKELKSHFCVGNIQEWEGWLLSHLFALGILLLRFFDGQVELLYQFVENGLAINALVL